MKIYRIEGDRTVIDMGRNSGPLVNVSDDMWSAGFDTFGPHWWMCNLELVTTDNTSQPRAMYKIDFYDSGGGGDEYQEKGERWLVSLYHGTKDTTHMNWDGFAHDLNNSTTIEKGNSYIDVNPEDNREWWEFHCYKAKGLQVSDHRPAPVFSEDYINTKL